MENQSQDHQKIASKLEEQRTAYHFAKSIADNPKRYIGFFLLICLIFLPAIFKINARWSPRIWFDADHEQIQKLDTFEKRFGNDQYVSFGIHNPNGVFNEKTLTVVRNLTEGLWMVPDVIRVESLANYNYIQAEEDDILIDPFIHEDIEFSPESLAELKTKAMNDNTLPDFYVSPDTTYTVIYGYLKPSLSGDPDFGIIVDALRKLRDKNLTDGVEITLTGSAVANNAFREVSREDNKVLMPFMIVFLLTLLFIQFRSFTAMGTALVLIGLTIGVTFGLIGYSGILFNSLLSAVPGVLLAICLADAVHIFTTYFHFRALNFNSYKSIKFSLTKNFQPTLLTSISTAISFFSITKTEIAPIRDLGILCGFGTLMAWLFTYIFLGATLALFSNFLDKYPSKTFEFYHLFKGKNQKDDKKATSRKFVHWIYKFRYFILVTFIGFTGLSAYIALQNEVNSDPMKYFHNTVPVRAAYDFAATKMDGLRGIELVVDSGKAEGIKDPEFLKRLENYVDYMVQDENITRVKSVLEIIKKMNQVLHADNPEYYKIPDTQKAVAELLFLYTIGLPQGMDLNNIFTLDNRHLRIRVSWNIEKSKDSEAKSKWLEEKGKDFGLDVETGGNAPIYLQMNTLVVESFFSSMAMALVLVSFLLLLVYRDLYVAMLSMLPNTIPLIFGGALMQLMGKYIDIGTSMVTTVCLGIAVDDTIHFVSSYKQYRKNGYSPLEALEETFTITGKALVVTTVLLVAGFGSFASGDFVPNRNFGILCSLILTMALITDLVFLPALLMILDRKEAKKDIQKNQALDSVTSTN